MKAILIVLAILLGAALIVLASEDLARLLCIAAAIVFAVIVWELIRWEEDPWE